MYIGSIAWPCAEWLVAAATQFKQNVQVLSDQPLKAWTQLAKAQDNASLRGYHAFSGNPAIRNRPEL